MGLKDYFGRLFKETARPETRELGTVSLAERWSTYPSVGLTPGRLAEIFREPPVPELDPAVRDCLIGKKYPGNVRDLRNLVRRIGQRHVGPGPITVGDIPAADRPAISGFAGHWRDEGFTESIRRALAAGASLEAIKSAAADTAYELALQEAAGDARQAACRLGVSPRAVQAKKAGQKRETEGN